MPIPYVVEEQGPGHYIFVNCDGTPLMNMEAITHLQSNSPIKGTKDRKDEEETKQGEGDDEDQERKNDDEEQNGGNGEDKEKEGERG
jgi:hypothetical protein